MGAGQQQWLEYQNKHPRSQWQLTLKARMPQTAIEYSTELAGHFPGCVGLKGQPVSIWLVALGMLEQLL